MQFLYVIIFLLVWNTPLNGIVDLDSYIQDFILDTKKIEISGYPDAFNPSIIRWRDSILMTFRIRDPITATTHQIGFVWLDEDFNPTTKPALLEIQQPSSCPYQMAQDPRLITFEDKVYIVFNDMVDFIDKKIRRMLVGELIIEQNRFYVENLTLLLNYEGEDKKRHEKNWVPFEYDNKFLLSYSIDPHIILKSLINSPTCKTVSKSHSAIKWNWGILRGGSQAYLIDGEYLAFFHSSKEVSTVQSKGKKISHYVMGAYTFNSTPPFKLTRISPEPLVSKTFYNGPLHNTWKPLRVVFPGGFIFNEKYIWVAYGRQDHEVWVAKLDKKGLLDSLIPIKE